MDTGLIYMQARYYDPSIGRFLAPDPVGFSETNLTSFNRYAYANNNPYKYVDPDGRNSYPGLRGAYRAGEVAALMAYGKLYAETIKEVLGINDLVDTVEAVKEGDAVGIGLAAVGVAASLTKTKVVAEVVEGVAKKTPKIKWGAQEKHFPGHNSYTPGRSTLTSDPTKLAEKAGTGQQVGDIPVGQPGSKERVNFGEEIGTYIDQVGNASPTTNGIIHYSKEGIHIVPSRP